MVKLTSLLLGDTDSSATATSGLGVLTTDTKGPHVAKTTVRSDLSQALQIITELGIQSVGNNLGVGSGLDITLSVQQVGGDFVGERVLNDVNELVLLLLGQFAGAVEERRVLKKGQEKVIHE
jgi:hypothetical protein